MPAVDCMMAPPKRPKTGVCPVCHGAKRVRAGDLKWKHVMAGYDKVTDTMPCGNCGGQRMFGVPTGIVDLRRDTGQPCVHEYTGYKAGNCFYVYTCVHCGDRYEIDSGD